LEEEIRILKAQINTAHELKKIWGKIERLEGKLMNKKGTIDPISLLILILIIIFILLWLKQRGLI